MWQLTGFLLDRSTLAPVEHGGPESSSLEDASDRVLLAVRKTDRRTDRHTDKQANIKKEREREAEALYSKLTWPMAMVKKEAGPDYWNHPLTSANRWYACVKSSEEVVCNTSPVGWGAGFFRNRQPGFGHKSACLESVR